MKYRISKILFGPQFTGYFNFGIKLIFSEIRQIVILQIRSRSFFNFIVFDFLCYFKNVSYVEILWMLPENNEIILLLLFACRWLMDWLIETFIIKKYMNFIYHSATFIEYQHVNKYVQQIKSTSLTFMQFFILFILNKLKKCYFSA